MVRQRHVFMLVGFDPKGAGHYHRLYRAQAALQSRVTKTPYAVSERRDEQGAPVANWTVVSGPDEAPVQTNIELLRWDDIVRAHWQRGPWAPITGAWRSALHYVSSGTMRRLYAAAKPPVLAALSPLTLAAFTAVGALGVAGVVALALIRSVGVPVPVAAFLGAGAFVALMAGAGRLMQKIEIGWFLRLVRFTHLQASNRASSLAPRLHEFGQRIAERLRAGDADEVLVVGHSVGAIVAVQAVAEALRRAATSAGNERTTDSNQHKLALLTLGQCIPVLGALPEATRLRDDLRYLADARIEWTDVSSPLDWAAFPHVDPYAACGMANLRKGRSPRLRSPSFHRLYRPASYAKLKANRFQVHRQYLMASELAGDYDFFAITAGPQTLRERFADPVPATRPAKLAT